MSIDMWLKIIALVPMLVEMVEKLFGSGTGPIKKQVVTDMAGAALAGLQEVSKGGQKETVDKLAPVISPVIDSIAGALFPSGSVVDLKPSD